VWFDGGEQRLRRFGSDGVPTDAAPIPTITVFDPGGFREAPRTWDEARLSMVFERSAPEPVWTPSAVYLERITFTDSIVPDAGPPDAGDGQADGGTPDASEPDAAQAAPDAGAPASDGGGGCGCTLGGRAATGGQAWALVVGLAAVIALVRRRPIT
jgi:MYXO-CTERM domain-containing protein